MLKARSRTSWRNVSSFFILRAKLFIFIFIRYYLPLLNWMLPSSSLLISLTMKYLIRYRQWFRFNSNGEICSLFSLVLSSSSLVKLVCSVAYAGVLGVQPRSDYWTSGCGGGWLCSATWVELQGSVEIRLSLDDAYYSVFTDYPCSSQYEIIWWTSATSYTNRVTTIKRRSSLDNLLTTSNVKSCVRLWVSWPFLYFCSNTFKHNESVETLDLVQELKHHSSFSLDENL